MTDPRVERNRRAVHAAALELLGTDGVGGLTVDRLAEASGVSRSTIYRHWPDLPALVVAAFDETVHDGRARTFTKGDDPGAALLEYLVDYARRLNDPRYATVLLAVLEWSWRDPGFADVHAGTFADSRSRAAAILRAGRATGLFRRDLKIADAVEDVVAPFLYRRLVLRRTITPREVRDLHARLLTRLAP